MTWLLDFALPFVFVLAVVYGALEIGDVFKNNGVKGLIAIVIAFFAVSTPTLASFLKQILPIAAIVFIVIFFFGFLFSFAKEKEGKKDYVLLLIEIALILIFLGAFQGNLESFLPGTLGISGENLIMGLGIVLVIMILFAAYKLTKGDGGQG